jgi:class 3 adenylate cyclase
MRKSAETEGLSMSSSTRSAGAAGPLPAMQSADIRHLSLERRRLGLVRFGGLFGAAVVGFYFVYNLVWPGSDPIARRPLLYTLEIVFFLLFLAAALMARRARRTSSYFLMITICLTCGVLAALFGRSGGSHLFLLLIGPLSALVFVVRRPYGMLAWCLLATVLHLALQFLIPAHPALHSFAFEQMLNPFAGEVVLTQPDINYIINIVAIEFGLGLCTYLAMHWAAAAEGALEREYARSELLLQNLLPPSIASRLKENPGTVIAEQFESVSILFADVVNFTPTSAARRPEEIVGFLSRLFGQFDLLAEKHGLEKIKTIGDCYMVAGGMPEKSDGHAQSMADMALEMIEMSERLMADFDEQLSIRIGLHVGPATAGVIGHNKPYYDVWGDTINIGSRMESSGVAGRIQITPEVRDILGASYDFEHRGEVDIKGKGPMNLYFLVGRSQAAE